MASGGVVLGFLLMLFLPCAITLLGESEAEEESLETQATRMLDPDARAHAPVRPRTAVQSQAQSTPTAQSPAPLAPLRPSSTPLPVLRDVPSATVRTRASLFPPEPLPVPTLSLMALSAASPGMAGTWHEVTAPAPVELRLLARTQVPGWEQTAPVRNESRSEVQWTDGGAPAPRAPRLQQARLEMAELDVLRARAIAVRAHAEALAAVARAARAKAEAASENAISAEREARDMSQYVRRAA